MVSFINRTHFVTIALLHLSLATVQAQSVKLSKKQKKDLTNIESGLRQSMAALHPDSLWQKTQEGDGERAVCNLIASEYAKMGLSPQANSLIQPFWVHEGLAVVPGAKLALDDLTLEGNDYFPFAWSGNCKLQSATFVALQEAGEPWWYDLKEWTDGAESSNAPAITARLKAMAAGAAKKGATALLVYNSSPTAADLPYNAVDTLQGVKIPVVYIKKTGVGKAKLNNKSMPFVVADIALAEKKHQRYNIVAGIDNAAPHTIVIGTRLYSTETGAQHRYNSFATATLIELGKLLKQECDQQKKAKKPSTNSLTHANFLFVHISGPPMDTLGSQYFAANSPVALESINYMVNIDIPNAITNSVSITGTHSSPTWSTALPKTGEWGFAAAETNGGNPMGGPTLLYSKKIPVLHVNTAKNGSGAGEATQIAPQGYEVAAKIVGFLAETIRNTMSAGKLAYTPDTTLEGNNTSNNGKPVVDRTSLTTSTK